MSKATLLAAAMSLLLVSPCLSQQNKALEASEVLFSFPILPPEMLIKEKPGSIEIYQENDSPLNGRRALLMIHGGGGE
ncbi:MAG: hypothetical protein IAF58_15620, partial [Leptolyngbya sp.]|nr:hypothetical protein [Candidatus Melainabacteria bacterium]